MLSLLALLVQNYKYGQLTSTDSSTGAQFTGFTSTKVQILTPEEHRCSVYLRYWYKSTNTDAAQQQGRRGGGAGEGGRGEEGCGRRYVRDGAGAGGLV